MANGIRLAWDERAPARPATLAAFAEATGIAVESTALAVEPAGRIELAALGELRADLLLVDDAAVAELLRAGRLAPLGRRAHEARLDLDDVPQAAIDRYRAGDMVYAIPVVARSNVLLYRGDLVDRYGIAVPKTWDDLRSAASLAQAAARGDGDDAIVGFIARGAAGYGENFWFAGSSLFPAWGWRWNRGAESPPLAHVEATVDALRFLVDLTRESGPADAAAITGAAARRRLLAGGAIFAIETGNAGAWRPPRTFDLRIAPAPSGPSGRREPGLGCYALCIPVSSERADEAWELTRWLYDRERMLEDAITAGDPEPARSSVIEDPAYARAFGGKLQATMRLTRRFARINRPLIPRAYDLGDIIGAAIESALSGAQSADEALRVAQAMIDSMDWT